MACRLILVDDEPNILYGLRDSIPWSEMGYEIVGAFSDGMDALTYIENHPVDVVLTDIKMKRLSGIELAECVYNRWPQIIIVFFIMMIPPYLFNGKSFVMPSPSVLMYSSIFGRIFSRAS